MSRATLVNDTVDEAQLKDKYLMDSGKYDVIVKKQDNGWIVEDMEFKEKIEPEVIFPLPTPKAASDEASNDNEE